MTRADHERAERGQALVKALGDTIDRFIEAHAGEVTVRDLLTALSIVAAAVAQVPESATKPPLGVQ